MRPGIDAAFAGSTADFNLAAQAGVEWVGEYFGGGGCYHVWSNADREALAASKIPYRLPIWVPPQSFGMDPRQEAEAAIEAFRLLGFKNVLGLDIEQNSRYILAWGEIWANVLQENGIIPVGYHGNDKSLPFNMASWLAFWTGNAPTKLDPKTAIQYRGATNSYGMSVDFNMAADDFPLEGMPTVTNGGTTTVDITQLPKGRLNGAIVAHALTSTRNGGWMVGADGGVFCWGDAKFFGAASHIALAGPITCIAPAHDDQGYTLIGSDGGTFPYGPHAPKIPSLA